MAENLMEGTLRELRRNRELLEQYRELPGNVGAFGAMMIQRSIQEAEAAISSGNIVDLVRCYSALERNK